MTKIHEGRMVEMIHHSDSDGIQFFGTVKGVLGHDKEEMVTVLEALQVEIEEVVRAVKVCSQ